MKKLLEITLTTLHLGLARRTVTLQIGNEDEITEGLDLLRREKPKDFEKLRTAIRIISEIENYSNDQKFKNLKGGLYEIKISGYRVYAFLDEHPDCEKQLVICACDGGKANKKSQNADIKKAREIREKYLNERDKETTHVILQKLENEKNNES